MTQWRKFRKGGYKEKGGPIGTTPDRLVVTAVDCVISRNSFSLKFLSLDILVWWCHFLLIRFALRISESWQPFLLTVSKLETWHTPLSWQCFSDVTAVSWNRCLLSSLSLGILIFWHPFLLTPSSLDILFSPHPILLTRFSLGTIFLVSFCFHILLRTLSVKNKISLNCFPLRISVLTTLLSWGVLSFSCLPLGVSFFWHFRTCEQIHPVYYKTAQFLPVQQSLHKVLPSTTSYHTKLAQSTSQYYFVLQSLHRVSKYYFVRFHPHQRHLDEAIPLRSALQSAKELPQPRLQTQTAWKQPFQCKLHAWIAKRDGTEHVAHSIFQR